MEFQDPLFSLFGRTFFFYFWLVKTKKISKNVLKNTKISKKCVMHHPGPGDFRWPWNSPFLKFWIAQITQFYSKKMLYITFFPNYRNFTFALNPCFSDSENLWKTLFRMKGIKKHFGKNVLFRFLFLELKSMGLLFYV